jgi:hypothetical protein
VTQRLQRSAKLLQPIRLREERETLAFVDVD